MRRANESVENFTIKEDQSGRSNESGANAMNQDWDDFWETLMYYGLESWRGGCC